MFTINDDMSIYVTRGDIVCFGLSANNDGESYKFMVGDIVRFKVVGKKDCAEVILQKDFPVTTAGETVQIFLTSKDTRIGGVINKHSDYWYEIELNPETNPQTLVGYDDDGAKIFRLFPEGRNLDIEEPDITPEDVAIMDTELDATSRRPVENMGIVRGIESVAKRVTNELTETINGVDEKLTGEIRTLSNDLQDTQKSLETADQNLSTDIAEISQIINNNIPNELSGLNNRIDDEANTRTDNINSLTNDLNKLTAIVEMTESNHDVQQAEINDIGGRLTNAEEEIGNLGERLYGQNTIVWEGTATNGGEIEVYNPKGHNIFKIEFQGANDETDRRSLIVSRSDMLDTGVNYLCGNWLDVRPHPTEDKDMVASHYFKITAEYVSSEYEKWNIKLDIALLGSGSSTDFPQQTIKRIYGIM